MYSFGGLVPGQAPSLDRSEFFYRCQAQHQPLGSLGTEVHGQDRVVPLVLNIDHLAQAILIVGHPVAQREVLNGQAIRLGLARGPASVCG